MSRVRAQSIVQAVSSISSTTKFQAVRVMRPLVTPRVSNSSGGALVVPTKNQARHFGTYRSAGLLDGFAKSTLTPAIGTEYKSLQLTDVVKSDALMRDLAIEVSERGAVFFRNQNLALADMQHLGMRMGELTGRPKDSGLHVHPVTPAASKDGDAVAVISNAEKSTLDNSHLHTASLFASHGWHSDITFENAPSDYAVFKIASPPASGGDTLWASCYEMYDRLSPTYARFLEGLTAVHSGAGFLEVARTTGMEIRSPRGSPLNTGSDLIATHPLVRTNPVTGWKSVFVNRAFTTRITELSVDESDRILGHLFALAAENHDLQVRFKWTENDIAVWDNRCTLHTATNDYGTALREGKRVLSVGERPYLDPHSAGRTAALLSRQMDR